MRFFNPPPPKKYKIDQFLKSLNWSNYVAQRAWTSFPPMLGPVFDFTTNLTIFGHVWLLQNMLKPLFEKRFQQELHFHKSPPQKIKNTFWGVLLHVCFVGFLPCPAFVHFLRGMQKHENKFSNKTTNNKQEHKMQTR